MNTLNVTKRWIRHAHSMMLGMVLMTISTICVAETQTATPESILSDWMSAYNRHSIEDMLDHAHPEIEWLFINEDQVLVETRGSEALASGLKSYFSSLPSARGTLHNLNAHDRFITVTEQAHWIKDDEPRSQCSLAVYEFEDNLIRRVWYYPATACSFDAE